MPRKPNKDYKPDDIRDFTFKVSHKDIMELELIYKELQSVSLFQSFTKKEYKELLFKRGVMSKARAELKRVTKKNVEDLKTK